MKHKLGNILMILGSVLILSALALFLCNQREASRAEQAVSDLIPQLHTAIEAAVPESLPAPEAPAATAPTAETEPVSTEMPVVEIDGYDYIGYISFPSLELELPVMADWDYTRLKIAPCRYAGSTVSDDLVIMAHNYTRHFGRLRRLTEGDSVIFTDAEGQSIAYQVVALDILNPTAIEEMTSGSCDLTLFTCTYGGKSRVTVYCNRAEE